MSLVVVCVDQLPAYLLGPYGNTMFPTPAIDQLAAQGFTLERGFLQGELLHNRLSRNQWLSNWQQQDWQVTCFDQSEDELDFATQIPLEVPRSHQNASDWTECTTAIYTSQVLAHMDSLPLTDRQIVWIDLPLLRTSWDAPLAWREYLAGEEDPEILTGIQIPNLPHSSSQPGNLQTVDPDIRLLWEQACSAQIMLLDHCLEVLQDWLAEAWPSASILLTSQQGFSLGEHGGIGEIDNVHSEQTQVPWIFSPPDQPSAVRIPGVQSTEEWSQLVQEILSQDRETAAIGQRLEHESQQKLGWCQYSLFGQLPAEDRQAVLCWNQTQVAVRTNLWSFIWSRSPRVQLYVAPDDRFEQNDVADRCHALANLFLRNVGRFGYSLFTQLPDDCWWLQADETQAALPQNSEENPESSREWEAGLADLPEDFWIAAP